MAIDRPRDAARLADRGVAFLGIALLGALILAPALAAAAGLGPIEGGTLPAPLPLFPPDNWWNLDISQAPVDPGSASFIGFINNGGTRKLHPDFGGTVSPGSAEIYGMPYAVVDGTQPKLIVDFVSYPDESDGVGVPFYPIPTQAITQPHWIEGGDPGDVDLRDSQDRHLIIVDRDNNYLYELYNVFYNSATGQWEAGSGAFWDMKTDNRRPEGWTSADAAGLQILPGLVRYDEVYDPTVTDILHAFRVTVRATNGHVYPASHSAGSTSGALPMGARLRLKSSTDISGFTPEMQKIFRAMKTYGLIVADNGTDMYITGTFDTRWNNDILNPAFAGLSASDFEVVQLGWNPAPAGSSLSLVSLAVTPASVVGGQSSTGTVTLSGPAPSPGVVVTLGSGNPSVVTVPASATLGSGATSTTFPIGTSSVTASTLVNISGSYNGSKAQAVLTATPAAPPPAAPAGLATLALSSSAAKAGSSFSGSVGLSGPAPAGGMLVNLSSNKPSVASVPASVRVPAGSSSATFTVSALRAGSATITASHGGVKQKVKLTVTK